uniref:Uncharacterized protein n=1 Tax=Oryza punctata TaxID=4537 RepID=A0A0E0MCE3_ORYPU
MARKRSEPRMTSLLQHRDMALSRTLEIKGPVLCKLCTTVFLLWGTGVQTVIVYDRL